eukprot:CAMPEP_0174302608 /NCGR_PEP_ID=MMETSP0809-20121228/59718_1 /TAXON_ID=73025 ORGANISM="Eutreptiella gymnastica-like, Strain CCMP1594" /NCGR_SAMPLE_ID=MMETSP0809 /ASSEMBLY_ACC=CAM_ASM_000658 /LENGTH=455 /DNA_ID=CAMNT_0015408525 /DNA_START=89 /DNA_END=1456 /DNA_ORIENTATION=+
MSLSEVRQVQHMADSGKNGRARWEKEEREALKEKSDARVRNWPNTIEALRLKKEVGRKERLDREEEIRAAQDVQEADYQASQREAAIERANLILYEQDDRIKTFNHKMFLSHVLEEREKQLELLALKKEREKQKEEAWDHKLKEQLHQAKVEEDRQKAARIAKARQVQKEQKEQLEGEERKLMQRQKEAKEEGLAIRHAAEKAILEEYEEDRNRKQQAKHLAHEYADANQELKKFKIEQQERDKAEDEKIEKFAKLKESQMLERRRRAEEKFSKDMDRRQQMIEKQAEYLATLRDKHEERLKRQMDQVAAEKENREIEDKERAEKQWQDIVNSRNRQLAMKQRKKEIETAEQAAFRNQWSQAAEQLLVEEMEDRHSKREKNKRLLAFQKMQMREKEAKSKAEKEQERMEGEMMRKAMHEEEEMFSKYVSTVMSEYAAKGRNLGTMRNVRRRGDIA